MIHLWTLAVKERLKLQMLGLGPVVFRQRPAQQADGALRASRRLAEADMGDLGVGIGDPRQGREVRLGGQTEQRVADDDARMISFTPSGRVSATT